MTEIYRKKLSTTFFKKKKNSIYLILFNIFNIMNIKFIFRSFYVHFLLEIPLNDNNICYKVLRPQGGIKQYNYIILILNNLFKIG